MLVVWLGLPPSPGVMAAWVWDMVMGALLLSEGCSVAATAAVRASIIICINVCFGPW